MAYGGQQYFITAIRKLNQILMVAVALSIRFFSSVICEW
jgi:hypothetical protein